MEGICHSPTYNTILYTLNACINVHLTTQNSFEALTMWGCRVDSNDAFLCEAILQNQGKQK